MAVHYSLIFSVAVPAYNDVQIIILRYFSMIPYLCRGVETTNTSSLFFQGVGSTHIIDLLQISGWHSLAGTKNNILHLVWKLMLRSRAMENRIVSTCELVFTSVWRSSAFVVVMW